MRIPRTGALEVDLANSICDLVVSKNNTIELARAEICLASKKQNIVFKKTCNL